MTEPGYRAGDIAQHHQFRPRRAGLGQHHVDRHAAGGHRLAQRLAEIDRPGPGASPAGGQPGRQCSGQRRHHSTHLAQLLTGGAQEFNVLGKLRNAVHLNVIAAQLLRGASFGLSVDHLAQLGYPLCGKRFGDLLLRGSGLVAVRREQPRQQLALEFVQRHRLERLVGREGRAAAGSVFPVGLDDPGDHRDQALVHVGEIGVFGQQIQQHLAHRLDVVGGQSVVVLRVVGLVVGDHRASAQRRREPQVEHGVIRLAVIRPAQHGARDALAQYLAVAQAQGGHHPAGIHRLRRADRNPRPAKRFHEADQVTGQPVRGERPGGSDAAGGHGGLPSSAAARRLRAAGRIDV